MFRKFRIVLLCALSFSIPSFAADKNPRKVDNKRDEKPLVKTIAVKRKPKPEKKSKINQEIDESSGPKIKKIEFSGVKNTPKDVLKKISNKYFGNGLYGTWTDEMLSEIRAIPIVREANLMRDMTGNITIQIKEREPIAYLYLDQCYWMDEQGNVVLPIETNSLQDKVFFSGPWKTPAEYLKKNGPLTVLSGIFFYTQLLANEFEEKKISEIHFDANLGWIMYRIGSRAPIVFGTQNLPEKVERFVQVAPQLVPIENSIARIDADFNDRVVVKLLTSPGK